MSKFSRWTPTLGVCFKWDSQKVLEIAHFGVFRHIGGIGGGPKTYGPQNIVSQGQWQQKFADVGPPRA